MFYYLLAPVLSFNFVLILAAAIPAIALLIFVYKSDKLEKESGRMLFRLAVAGVLSSLIALVLERVFCFLLDASVPETSPLYNVILYFVIVAFVEEGAKYFMLWLRTRKSPEFNCLFDGVVYAVFVSLGFAIWENISYVLSYGLGVALIRAVTAIPGHACFGVLMGVFYAFARRSRNDGQTGLAKFYRFLAIILPALTHGAYDYIASIESSGGTWIFIGFIVVLFVISFIMVRKMSKKDRYI